MGLAEFDGIIPPVILGLFLLDDICFDRRRQVVGLAGQVGRHVVVDAILFECLVAGIGPQNSHHPEFMGITECLGDLLNLASALIGTEIDCRAHCNRAHVESLIDVGE